MLIVAGLSLRNLAPKVWDPESPFYLKSLGAVMVSYGEFHQMPKHFEEAKKKGLRKYLQVPRGTSIFLDNGAFYFLRTGDNAERRKYRAFVESAKPDWYPTAFDSIPMPQMSDLEQQSCFDLT